MNIEKNKELRLENLLSVRKSMTQLQIQEEMQRIGLFIKENNLKKNGPIITTSYSIEQKENEAFIDMEILVPVNEEFSVSNGYVCKKEFLLTNAVCIKHKGNPAALQNSYAELNRYIQENRLSAISTGYNVNVKEMEQGGSIDDIEIDVYIGVSPNIL